MPEETEEQAVVVPLYGPEPLFTDDELHNLRAIKMANGNDILACIVATDPDHMVVKHPCQILRMVREDGNVQVILSKWTPFSVGETYIVMSRSVVTYCKVNPDMKEFYITSVKSQLEDSSESTQKWPEWMDHPIKTQIN